MTDLNSDTITLSNTLYDTMTIPAFDASSLSSYTSSHVMSGTAASDTITISAGPYSTSSGNIMYTSGTSSNYYAHNGIGASTWSTTDWNSASSYGTPFVDKFPDWNAFKQLCSEYPGLEKAYENLKTFYKICYEDSLLPKDDK
jgi:hypothetical protein